MPAPMPPRPRVAVVEDNADNRLLVAALLEERCDVLEYASGHEALAALPEDRPDAVLLDIALPGLDGVEVLRRLRAIPAAAGLPVIALTAHAMQGDRERFLAAGFDGYVSKPITDAGVLLDAVSQALGRRAAT